MHSYHFSPLTLAYQKASHLWVFLLFLQVHAKKVPQTVVVLLAMTLQILDVGGVLVMLLEEAVVLQAEAVEAEMVVDREVILEMITKTKKIRMKMKTTPRTKKIQMNKRRNHPKKIMLIDSNV